MAQVVDPRVQLTQDKLRSGLFRLLKTKAVEDITVTALCQEAGINRRTFYLHYDNVIEVFTAYEDVLSARVHQALIAPHPRTKDLVATFNQIFDENLTGFSYLCLNNRQQRLLQDLQQMLFEVMLASRYHEPTPAAIVETRYVSAGIVNVYVYWVNHQDSFSRQALSATVSRLVHQNLA